MRTPERYRRAATTDRVVNIAAVFRASFPEVPAEVVAGHLQGERMLSLTRPSTTLRSPRSSRGSR